MSHLLEARNLFRYYGDRCVVRDVSFTLSRGEVLGFLGPNGAGKSTTMGMITGTLAPSAGAITINGVDLLQHPRRAKAYAGYLPEQPPLYPELTVDEYLRYCGRLRQIPRAGLSEAIRSARNRCGLEASGRRLIGNLSKGYRQRVGLAQSILHRPDVVILDEPTAGLDPIQIREIRDLIQEIGTEHGVILSTHILPEVQAVCDRLQIIHEGVLVFADTLDGVYRRLLPASLLLALRNPPGVESLQRVAGVGAVEPLGEGRFRIRFKPERDPAEALAAAAVAKQWGLRELTPERRSLEQIFVELTTGEEPRQAA